MHNQISLICCMERISCFPTFYSFPLKALQCCVFQHFQWWLIWYNFFLGIWDALNLHAFFLYFLTRFVVSSKFSSLLGQFLVFVLCSIFILAPSVNNDDFCRESAEIFKMLQCYRLLKVQIKSPISDDKPGRSPLFLIFQRIPYAHISFPLGWANTSRQHNCARMKSMYLKMSLMAILFNIYNAPNYIFHI